MERSLQAPHAPTLRAIIENTGVPSLLALTRRPGVRDVYRVTAHYHDGRARDSVATLVDHRMEGAHLETAFRVTFSGKPLLYPIPNARYAAFGQTLHELRFDQLKDQPDLPLYGVDLWLIERAAGSYLRGIIVAPELASGVYTSLVCAVRAHLPEALREVR
jgi:hypothetical protein